MTEEKFDEEGDATVRWDGHRDMNPDGPLACINVEALEEIVDTTKFKVIEFSPGKVGMSLDDNNAVDIVVSDGPASMENVKVGWIVRKVDDQSVLHFDPAEITKIISAKNADFTMTFEPVDVTASTTQKVFMFNPSPVGMEFDNTAKVKEVDSDGQADKYGVKVDWYVRKVDNLMVSDKKHLEEIVKNKIKEGKPYTITFEPATMVEKTIKFLSDEPLGMWLVWNEVKTVVRGHARTKGVKAGWFVQKVVDKDVSDFDQVAIETIIADAQKENDEYTITFKYMPLPASIRRRRLANRLHHLQLSPPGSLQERECRI